MCMSTVQLNLVFNQEEGTYVGTGYKAVKTHDVYGEPRVPIHGYDDFVYIPGIWQYSDKRDYLAVESNIGYPPYPNGFHIFNRQEDAALYGDVNGFSIYRVAYKEVRSVGTQFVGFYNKMDTYGVCIVAGWLKLLDVVVEPTFLKKEN